MKVVITGASGFIGKQLKKELEKDISLDVIPWSLRGSSSVKNFPKGDVCIHLAAIAHVDSPNKEEVFIINRDLAIKLAEITKKIGYKQFIFLSSVMVWGSETSVINRDSILQPDTFYGEAKYEAEKNILQLGSKNYVSTIIRVPMVYGPSPKANILMLIRFVERFPIIPLNFFGNRRSLVYVGNLTAFIHHLIIKPSTGVFIIQDERSLSTGDIVRLIANGLGKKRIWLSPPACILKMCRAFTPTIYRKLFDSLVLSFDDSNALGFIRPVKIEQGFELMLESYKKEKNNDKRRPLKSSK